MFLKLWLAGLYDFSSVSMFSNFVHIFVLSMLFGGSWWSSTEYRGVLMELRVLLDVACCLIYVSFSGELSIFLQGREDI